ncbi:hypothetical protein FNW02_02370 [Komarekiella sp. 'clone 1']|uniref:Uncharacterized protein n=1 Tax=Komarekiella delphini-convector SJRDD-AB1 TaxID=2593771 RepID=A0AA40STJ8_9NOST|nr:hypothetical protein [Komarekiella delphini-convector]MBD6614737.1 hypothetical protein [Komarekiella delphini-convector SJRDD-AB1]
MSISSQIITSDLLMDLSTEEQQFLSGGFSKGDNGDDDDDDDDKCKKDKSPSKIFIVKVYKKRSCCKPKPCCSH